MGRASLSLSCGYLLWRGERSAQKPVLSLPARGRGTASCLRVYRLDFCNLISANAVKNSSMAARETYDGPTPELPYDLRAALSLGDTETIRRALAAGVSPNVEVRSTSLRNETYYWPLLLLACGGGVIGSDRPELISMLLEAGANPDGPPDKKVTPIHMAVNHSRIRTVEVQLVMPGGPRNAHWMTFLFVALTVNSSSTGSVWSFVQPHKPTVTSRPVGRIIA